MLVYILIAVVAVVAGWWGLNKLKTANVAMLVRNLKTGIGMLAIGVGVLLTLRGNLGHGISLGMLGIWLLSGASLPSVLLPGQRRPSAGKTSRITTDHLEMELDHSTGAMRGRVLKGVFAGCPIERLAPAELALLWRDCRFVDPRSAQLIEAWLNRVHPTWREDMARAENEPGAGGIMTVKEAYEILGLKPGASDDEIRRAHRELMKRMHPDAGGSDYLAAKINEAKDALLGR